MTQRILGCGYACLVAMTMAGVVSVKSTVAAQASGVTVEGCIVKEIDAPGRVVPEEERTRIVRENNFVLAQTKVTAGTDLTASTDSSDVQAPLMYRIKDVKKAELNGHVGHRVQIEGTFDKIGRAKNALSYASDLVELKGTSIKMLAETCK
jgi:hypothetical protein